MIAETLQGLSGSPDPVLDRELMAHATGLSGLRGSADDNLSGFFSKIFKSVGPLLPIAGAALAPFTGGASLIAAGALTAAGNALAPQPGQAGQTQQLPPAPVQAPPPPPAPSATPAGGSNTGLLMLAVVAVALLVLTKK